MGDLNIIYITEEFNNDPMIQRDVDNKKIYSITDKGRKELTGWFTDEIEVKPVRSEFMLKLLFSSSQSKELLIEMIEKHKKQSENSIARYKAMLDDLENGISSISMDRVPYLRAVLRKAIIAANADKMWCDETLKDFK